MNYMLRYVKKKKISPLVRFDNPVTRVQRAENAVLVYM
jgi:hypothetical protein